MSTTLELLYALSTVVFVGGGLAVVGMGVRAYVETAQTPMLFLAIGFALAVAGSAATMISAFLYGFENPRFLLLVKSGLLSIGFLFVLYSLVTYEN